MHRRLPLIAVVLGLLLATAACGESNKVGEGVDLAATGGDGGSGALRDPSRTTTTLPPELDDAVNVTTTAPPTTVSQQAQPDQASATTAPQNIIKIQDDEQGHFFEPLLYQVPVGQTVTWKNVGTKPRQIAAKDNTFVSPEIPPGGEWSFTFTATGTYSYQDLTRPYATSGQVQVY